MRVHFVYEWYPLTIGTLEDEPDQIIDFHTVIEKPRSFKYLGGSILQRLRKQRKKPKTMKAPRAFCLDL